MTTKETIQDLLQIDEPRQWKDFIFHLQTTLIEDGYVETLTMEGRSDFTVRMQGLYDFFGKLDGPGKQS